MEGSGRGEARLYNPLPYGYSKLAYPSLLSRPPLSALDKFLLGQPDVHHSPSNQAQTSDLEMGLIGGFGELSPFFNGISSHASGSSQISSSWTLPVLQDQPNRNYLSFDESLRQGGVYDGGLIRFGQDDDIQEMSGLSLESKISKPAKVPSPFLIKGQWTEEEDCSLIHLVTKIGLRKWAEVAENLLGRTGKQCRERWQNHLRPDIKKDAWTEEEERQLIKAHEKYGNKWAEIAKRIKGRTENSIKNHWNATKRRQNSRRKCKKSDGKSIMEKSNVLQEYIKSKTLGNVATPTPPTSSDDPSMKTDTLIAELSDIESPMLDYASWDEENLFMQNFFKDCSSNPITPQESFYDMNQAGFALGPNQPTLSNAIPSDLGKEAYAPLSSDLYISHLLEGTGYYEFGSSSSNVYYDESEKVGFEMENARIDLPSKDMDLMEMVYSTSRNDEMGFNQPIGTPFWP